jgi:hypothetical protein
LERNGVRFYLFVEADRDKEANTPRDLKKRTRKGKYWIDTVEHYNKLIGDNLYKKVLNIPKGHRGYLLNVTVGPVHMQNMIDLCGPNKLIFSQYYSEFKTDRNANFEIPDVLPLLSTPWFRNGLSPTKLIS